MNRKGMETSFTMLATLLIAAVMISGIVYVFLKTNLAGEGGCEISTIQFLGDLPDKVSSMSGPQAYKSRKEHSFKIPCGDRAYFINLDKIKTDPNAMKAFDTEPLIKSELESSTGRNFFVMSGNKIAFSSALKGLNVDYPYNICFDAKAKKTIDIEMEGLGKDGVKVIPHCQQLECTTVPEIVLGGDLDSLLDIICKSDPDCIAAERENINNAKEGVEVRLKISTCFPETTKIEFIIKPKENVEKAEDVKIIETVPKECIKSLADGVNIEGGEGEVVFEPDPMLVWTFGAVPEEKKVSYEIPGILSDYCRKQLKAVVSARKVKYSSGHADPAKRGRTIDTAREHPDRFKPERTALPKIREEHKKKWVEMPAEATEPATTTKERVLEKAGIKPREQLGAVTGGPIFVQGKLPDRRDDDGITGTVQNVFKRDSICPVYVKDTNPDGNCNNLNYQFSSVDNKVSCDIDSNKQKVTCIANSDGENIAITVIVTDNEGKSSTSTFYVDAEK